MYCFFQSRNSLKTSHQTARLGWLFGEVLSGNNALEILVTKPDGKKRTESTSVPTEVATEIWSTLD